MTRRPKSVTRSEAAAKVKHKQTSELSFCFLFLLNSAEINCDFVMQVLRHTGEDANIKKKFRNGPKSGPWIENFKTEAVGAVCMCV